MILQERLDAFERDLAYTLHRQLQAVENALPGILSPEKAEKLTQSFLDENLDKILKRFFISHEGLQKIDVREFVRSAVSKEGAQDLRLTADEVARQLRVHLVGFIN